MKQWVLIAALLVPVQAGADLYTEVGEDGVVTITTTKRRGSKVLYRARHKKPPRTRVAKTKPTPRKSSARPAKSSKALDAQRRALRYVDPVRGAAEHYGLPEALIWAVMRVESYFKPHVVSNKGAMGLMQLMPGTAKEMGVKDAFDPVQNIFGGSRYLRILANRFDGDLVLTLSGYHAGGGAVSRSGGIPYTKTAGYVRAVLNAYYEYQKKTPADAQ